MVDYPTPYDIMYPLFSCHNLGDLFCHQWNYVDNIEYDKPIDMPAVDKTLRTLWQQEALQ